MREYGKKALWGMLALALAVALSAGATRLIGRADGSTRADVTYYAAGEKPTFDAMDRLRDEMEVSLVPGAVTAYAQTAAQTIQSEDGIARTQVDALWVDGYGGLLLDARMLTGLLPVFAGQSDCALDAATALLLFGSTEIVGQKITMDDLELTVCGVFELPEGLLSWGASPGRGIALCPASLLNGDTGIDAFAFTVPGDGERSPAEQSAQWIKDAGIEVPSRYVDKAERYALYTLWTQVPQLLAALWVAGALLRVAAWQFTAGIRLARRIALDRLGSARAEWKGLSMSFAGGAAALVGAAAAVLCPPLALDIPPSYLPTRWSDLSFWPKLLTSLGEEAAQRAMETALRPELLEHALLRWVPWLGCLALMLGCIALHYLVSPIPKWIQARNHMKEGSQ